MASYSNISWGAVFCKYFKIILDLFSLDRKKALVVVTLKMVQCRKDGMRRYCDGDLNCAILHM